MNLKNKILLTLIAIIFAICLFNTNCFAYDYYSEDLGGTLVLPDDAKDNYFYLFYSDNYMQFAISTTPITLDYNSSLGGLVINASSGGTLLGTTKGSHISRNSDETDIDYINRTISSCYSTDMESLSSHYIHKDYKNGNLFTFTLLSSDVTFYDGSTLSANVTNSSGDTEERGTGDNTNPDSGETGNETIGGDSENTTDSDDSGGILSSIKEGFTNVVSFFTQLIEKIGNILETIGGWFTELFTKLGDWFSGLAESIGSFFTTLTNNISTFFSNLGQNITDKWNEWKQQRQEEKEQERLKEEEEKNKQNQSSQDMSNNLNTATDKFSWYNNVIQNTRDMINVITSTESSATFNVNVNSKYYKGDLAIIDLSWYAPYKEIGDNVICIFCYLSFLWSFFTRLPNILSGSGASNYSIAQIKEDKK